MKVRVSTICKWLIFLTLPVLAYADSGDGLRFTPPDSDLSLGYLSDIFGVVPGVLHGVGSQIMGVMFGVFNSACLSLAGIVATYILIVSTLNTAHEGEMLGKKWNEIWTPIRAACGVGLLMPKVSGYSFIQVFVMWVVVQGIGAADSIWNVTLNYLQYGGTIIKASYQPSVSAAGQNALSDLFRDMVCLYALQDALNGQFTAATGVINPITGMPLTIFNNTGPAPDLIGSVNPLAISVSPGQAQVTMPIPNLKLQADDPFDKFKGACGSISWSRIAEPSAYSSGYSSASYNGPNADGTVPLNDARTIAVTQLITAVGTAARKAVYNAQRTSGQNYLGRCEHPPCTFSTWNVIGGVQLPYEISGADLQQAYADYQAIIQPALQSQAHTLSDASWMNNAKARGWIVAGSYYYNLAQMNIGVQSLADSSIPTVAKPPNDALTLGKTSAICKINGNPGIAPFNNMTPEACKALVNWAFCYRCSSTENRPPANIDELDEIAKTSHDYYYQIAGTGGNNVNVGGGGFAIDGDAAIVLAVIMYPIYAINQDFIHLLNAESNGDNPLLRLVILGSDMIGAVAFVFIVAGIGAIITACMGAVPCNTVSNGLVVLFGFLAPFLTAAMGAMAASGAVLAFYIPMIPFMVFTFAAVGWFIAVIEAMVAAPIVALGLVHPEGQHEIFGKSEQAIMLLTNVFLRPPMMVIGFIAGISLSYVGVWLLNQGFGQAASTVVSSASGLAVVFAPVFLAVIYASLVISMMNKAFSLIHVVPDKILRWLSGGQAESLGGESVGEAMSEVKGATTSAGKVMGDGMAGGTKAAIDAYEAKKDRADAEKKEDERRQKELNEAKSSMQLDRSSASPDSKQSSSGTVSPASPSAPPTTGARGGPDDKGTPPSIRGGSDDSGTPPPTSGIRGSSDDSGTPPP